MKISMHPDVSQGQCYRCTCCGRGCRTFLVAVRQQERQSIEGLCNWREVLRVDRLFIKTRKARPYRYALAKHSDGRCVFLNDDNLCEIHRRFGLRAKPVACQLYPFVITPFGGELRIGLRFDCPAVCESDGPSVSTYQREIQQLAEIIVPPGGVERPLPMVWGREGVRAEGFDAINEKMIQIVNSNAMGMVQRLIWLKRFADHAGRVRWTRIPEDAVEEVAAKLCGETLAGVHDSIPERREVVGRARKLLGHYFFILCHPTTIVDHRGGSFFKGFGERLLKVSAMRRLGRGVGALPKVQPDWKDLDLGQMERDFGRWPAEVEQMVSRYLTCRLAGVNYCGETFYGYSMVEGVESLLLAVVTIGWLTRLRAAGEDRDRITLADAYYAVMTVDGNVGYSPALGTGPSRWRLDFMNDWLEQLVVWYCS